MLFITRMLAAWVLAVIGSAVVATLVGDKPIGFTKQNHIEGLLGIGLIVGLPMLIFAVVIALPLSFYVAAIKPNWLSTLCASLLFAAIAAVLAAGMFPSGWKGAAQAFVMFAALLGFFWGLTGYITGHRASVS